MQKAFKAPSPIRSFDTTYKLPIVVAKVIPAKKATHYYLPGNREEFSGSLFDYGYLAFSDKDSSRSACVP